METTFLDDIEAVCQDGLSLTSTTEAVSRTTTDNLFKKTLKRLRTISSRIHFKVADLAEELWNSRSQETIFYTLPSLLELVFLLRAGDDCTTKELPSLSSPPTDIRSSYSQNHEQSGSLLRTIAELESRLHLEVKARSEAEMALTHFKDNIYSKAVRNLEILDAANRALFSELNGLKAMHPLELAAVKSALNAKNAELREASLKLKAAEAATAETFQNLSTQLSNLHLARKNAEVKANALEAELVAVKKEKELLQFSTLDQNAALQKCDEIISELQKQLAQSQASLSATELKLNGVADEYNRLCYDKESLLGKCQELQVELARVEQAEEEGAKAVQSTIKTQTLIVEKEKEIKKLNHTILLARMQYEVLRGELEEAKEARESAALLRDLSIRETAVLRSELLAFKIQRKLDEDAYKLVRSQVSVLQDDNASMAKRTVSLSQQLSILSVEAEHLKSELEKSRGAEVVSQHIISLLEDHILNLGAPQADDEAVDDASSMSHPEENDFQPSSENGSRQAPLLARRLFRQFHEKVKIGVKMAETRIIAPARTGLASVMHENNNKQQQQQQQQQQAFSSMASGGVSDIAGLASPFKSYFYRQEDNSSGSLASLVGRGVVDTTEPTTGGSSTDLSSDKTLTDEAKSISSSSLSKRVQELEEERDSHGNVIAALQDANVQLGDELQQSKNDNEIMRQHIAALERRLNETNTSARFRALLDRYNPKTELTASASFENGPMSASSAKAMVSTRADKEAVCTRGSKDSALLKEDDTLNLSLDVATGTVCASATSEKSNPAMTPQKPPLLSAELMPTAEAIGGRVGDEYVESEEDEEDDSEMRERRWFSTPIDEGAFADSGDEDNIDDNE